MTTVFNTISPRQSIGQKDYRGSYTRVVSGKQYDTILKLMKETQYEPSEVWKQFFTEPHDNALNWCEISVNAASEIIQFLMREKNVMAFMNKIQRTEKEQHELEMYPNGTL